MAFALGLLLGASHLRGLLELSAALAVGSALFLAATVDGISPAIPNRASAVTGDRDELRQVWADPVVRTVCAVVFIGFGVFVALTTWVQTLMEHHGVNARTADGLLLAMVGAGIVTAAVLPGPLAKRHAQAGTIAVSAIAAGSSCLVLALAPGVVTGYIALTLFGLVLLPVLPVMLELLEARQPESPGIATGLLWLAGNAGGVVVAVAVQAVIHHPGLAWTIMASGALVALPFSVRLSRRLRTWRPAGTGI
jgi:predicted MFS family arabinose efflux permease